MTSVHKRSCLVLLGVLILFPSLSLAQKGITYFKNKVNVPFALKNGQKVLPAGEYTLKIQEEGGQPMLSVLSKEGDPVLRNRGEHENVPEKDRTFQRGGRFRITTAPDPKNADQRLIVFLYDFVDARGGIYVRFRFQVPEAPAATN